MRVISGICKRRRFNVSHSLKVRPTTDSTKKNLFNVLPNYIDFEEGARALDLSVGTGSASIELIPRGCNRVIGTGKDHDRYAFIYKIMRELKTDKCLFVHGDVLRRVRGGREQFNFIFTDSPYELKGLEILPDLIFENNSPKEEGLFASEHGKTGNLESHPHFIERRVYGSVNFSFSQFSKL